MVTYVSLLGTLSKLFVVQHGFPILLESRVPDTAISLRESHIREASAAENYRLRNETLACIAAKSV